MTESFHAVFATGFKSLSAAVVIAVAGWLAPAAAIAQIRVSGGFLYDSLKIGQQTAFYLSAHYPSGETVLFPDSMHAFAPFEYQDKKYFATETDNGTSVDSTIYYLTTFELGPFLALKLPVYVAAAGDCTEYASNTDSIRVVQLVTSVPDSLSVDKLPLREHTAWQPVATDINYFIILSVLAGLLLIAAVVWAFFGRRIVRYLRARKLQKKHSQFSEAFNGIIAELQRTFSRSATEDAISLWKKYMEDLEGRPYTKLTSRETLRLLADEALGAQLSAIDRAIYGHDGAVVEPLRQLSVVADRHFSKKMEEVRHGK